MTYGWPTAVHGLSILCHVEGELSPVIVCEYAAIDREHFWQCWRALGGDEQNLVWESGQRFVSPGSAVIPLPVLPLWRRVLAWIAKQYDRLMFCLVPYEPD